MIEVPFTLSLRCEIVKLKQKGKPCKIITPQCQSPLRGGKERWGLCTSLILLISYYNAFSFLGRFVILISPDHKVYKVSNSVVFKGVLPNIKNASISSKFGRFSSCFISDLQKTSKQIDIKCTKRHFRSAFG